MSENFCEGQVIKDRKFQNITKERLKFTDCVFENCTFEDCKITGCSFVNCRFYKCSIISLTSKNSELKSAVFQNCNLIGIHCWNKLLPAGSYARSIDKVKDCCMKYNSFVEMPFGNLIFRAISSRRAYLRNATFRKAIFAGAGWNPPSFLNAISAGLISETPEAM